MELVTRVEIDHIFKFGDREACRSEAVPEKLLCNGA